MRFQIPQFIDVEDRIFGPFTLKQFIYMAGGASAGVIAVVFLGIFWGLLVASPIIALAAALAFYKINNRPFIYFLESAFKYSTKDKLYIWQKREPEVKEEDEESVSGFKFTGLHVPNLSGTRLKDMNWELDVKKKEDETMQKLES